MSATVHERVAFAGARLLAAGIPREEAVRDARLLARWLLAWDAGRYWTAANEEEPDGFAVKYESLLTRRIAREPVAYITGRQEFWGLSFEVTPAVLIPRPETELIVETALVCFPSPTVALDIADVGTGSGCLAVALAIERPHARIVATDLSQAAIGIARRNASRHNVSERIDFACADLLAGLKRRFHLIVANPPYVPEADRPGLEPEVRDNEPALALFAADSGLAVLRRLIAQAAAHLEHGGLLIFEFGFGQAGNVRDMIARTPGLTERNVRSDLQGIPRTAVAERV